MMMWLVVLLVAYVVLKEVLSFYERRDWQAERDRLTDKIMARSYTEFRLGKNIPEAGQEAKPKAEPEEDTVFDPDVGEI